jgi:putative N6-adenine-specific DNA methylase
LSTLRECVATCRPGLEAVVDRELDGLGIERRRIDKRAVTFWTDDAGLYRVNMGLRAAVQVLCVVRRFRARDYDLLYYQVRKTPWPQLFAVDRTIRVDVSGQSRQMGHSLFAAQRVKDAIADTFKKLCDGRRPSVDKEQPDVSVVVHLRDDEVVLCMDSSGEPLFKRGYRIEHGEAPLKEDLAAGLLLAAGLTPQMHLADPMCGSGTFLFEGWMIIAGIAPNLNRHFAFEHWHGYSAELHAVERANLAARAQPESDRVVCGGDHDAQAVALARRIAAAAFATAPIRIAELEVTDWQEPLPGGLMVCNPPYGERMGDPTELGQLYRDLGETAKRTVPGGKLAVFTTNRTAARQIRMRQDRGRTFFNGQLEGLLYEYSVR